MERRKKMVKVQLVVLLLGLLLMLIKFTAYFLTQSNAILSDALESIINVAAGAFAMYSLWLSNKPKDEDHPYGHGKIEFISSGFEGGAIIIAGVFIIYEAGLGFFYPPDVKQLDVGIYLVAFSGVVNFLMGRYLVTYGKQEHSDAMIADGKHLISDTYSSLGLVLGLLLVNITNYIWLDALIALLMGLLIVYTGLGIIRKSLAGLMDETNTEILDELLAVLNDNKRNEWIDVHNLRVLKYGSSYHIDAHVTLPWYYSLEQAHEELGYVDKLISEKFHNNIEMFVHADPCVPQSCSVCMLTDCKVRKSAFVAQVTWDKESVLKNQKHSLV
ncbi:MAG: cation diffusion facilitator family transporter [Bacteroidia bacterium]|nr:cation diffusion facilitator family transporter [Bacteroidia bacterium]